MGNVLVIGGADFSAHSLGKVTNQTLDLIGVDTLIGCFNGALSQGGVFCPNNAQNTAAIEAIGMAVSSGNDWANCLRFTKNKITVPDGAIGLGGVFNVLIGKNDDIAKYKSPVYQYDSNGEVINVNILGSSDIDTVSGIHVIDRVSGLFSGTNYGIALVQGTMRLNQNTESIRMEWALPYPENQSMAIQKSIVPVGLTYPRFNWIFES